MLSLCQNCFLQNRLFQYFRSMDGERGRILRIDENDIGLIQCEDTDEVIEFDASELEEANDALSGRQIVCEIIQVAYVNRRVAINVKLLEE